MPTKTRTDYRVQKMLLFYSNTRTLSGEITKISNKKHTLLTPLNNKNNTYSIQGLSR